VLQFRFDVCGFVGRKRGIRRLYEFYAQRLSGILGNIVCWFFGLWDIREETGYMVYRKEVEETNAQP
jgi:hypothetical protein